MLVSQSVVTSPRNACKFNKLKAKRQHYCESIPQLLCAEKSFAKFRTLKNVFLFFFLANFRTTWKLISDIYSLHLWLIKPKQ